MKQSLIVAATLLLAASMGPSLAETPKQQAALLGFQEQECWFPQLGAGDIRCGHMLVKENRQSSSSRTIRLPVVILSARAQVSPREPILYVTGGPGESPYLSDAAHIELWQQVQELFPQGHDLIVVGQRGVGLKEADFQCDEAARPEIILGGQPADQPPLDFRVELIEAVKVCAARLQAEGVDLTTYNSRESAADIAELRQALGIDELILYGVSYGSRLTLSTLRYHPEGIKAVILDSVLPAQANQTASIARNFEQALERLFADCAARAACTKRYGDLAKAYHDAGSWLQSVTPRLTLGTIFGPQERTFAISGVLHSYPPDDQATWPSFEVLFTDQTLDILLFDALYMKYTREFIPRLLQQTALQRTGTIKQQYRDFLLYSSAYQTNWALYLSHICHDEAPFEDVGEIASAIEAAGNLGHLIEYAWANFLCDHWPSGKAEAVEDTPVRSKVPALLLAGHFDPITPAAWARWAAESLPNGHAYELAGAGHGALFESYCAQRLVAKFLATLDKPPENTCTTWDLVPQPEN